MIQPNSAKLIELEKMHYLMCEFDWPVAQVVACSMFVFGAESTVQPTAHCCASFFQKKLLLELT